MTRILVIAAERPHHSNRASPRPVGDLGVARGKMRGSPPVVPVVRAAPVPERLRPAAVQARWHGGCMVLQQQLLMLMMLLLMLLMMMLLLMLLLMLLMLRRRRRVVMLEWTRLALRRLLLVADFGSMGRSCWTLGQHRESLRRRVDWLI